uniref:Uncharacterized protein n=1 Tax=Lotus japonicus TaxID=34305 RepID=I3T6G6_LOTJA|nr:unknown [Lotus japonicus]
MSCISGDPTVAYVFPSSVSIHDSRLISSASTYRKPWRLLMMFTISLWSMPRSAANSPESLIS